MEASVHRRCYHHEWRPVAGLRNKPVRVHGKPSRPSWAGRIRQHRNEVVVGGPVHLNLRRPVRRGHEPRGIFVELENGRVVFAPQPEIPVRDQDIQIRDVLPQTTGELVCGVLAEPGLGSYRRQQHRSVWILHGHGPVRLPARYLATEFEG